MRQTTAYTPQPDGLPGRVCAWFLKNTDEVLNAADIALKFNVPRSSISALLGPAIGGGLLRRVPGQATPTYAAGPDIERLHTAEPAPAQAIATEAAAESPPAAAASVFHVAKAARRKRQALPPFDPHAIPVKTGVPIPPPRNHREAAAKSSYQQLLERIPVGGMVELETTRAKSLMSCAKKLGIKGLTTRLLDDDGQVTGVWRSAA
jgi:hypothetical protein